MLKLWQKKLKLKFSRDIFDIVQFGSSILEGRSPNDLDIAVIFNKIPLKEQLNQAQNIKVQIGKEAQNILVHAKAFDFYSLFDKSNFSKNNIFFSGKSLISGDYFCKRFGFTSKVQIRYSLKNLKKKDKVRFNYLINGRMGKYGLMKKYGGRLLCPGLIEVPPEFEEIFIVSMKEITNKLEVSRVLEG